MPLPSTLGGRGKPHPYHICTIAGYQPKAQHRRMLRLLPLGLLALLTFFSSATLHARPSDASSWQKAYPAAEKGMKRIVIHLDAQKDEFSWKVELIVGKTLETDGVNRVALMGKIEERPVEGWGYTFYPRRDQVRRHDFNPYRGRPEPAEGEAVRHAHALRASPL
ncbi:ecotin [Verrucomicrobiota bacterium]|nr:ecotin [Verrucomicrobiota bacterium]